MTTFPDNLPSKRIYQNNHEAEKSVLEEKKKIIISNFLKIQQYLNIV